MTRKRHFRKLEIQCPKCENWDYLQKMELDDDNGYPYWGYPVCSNCGESNRNFKYLYRLQAYVDGGYLDEKRLLLIRSNTTQQYSGIICRP